MKPTTIAQARRICDECGARQVVVIAIYADGGVTGASYGETVRECVAVLPLLESIVDGIAVDLPDPRPGVGS